MVLWVESKMADDSTGSSDVEKEIPPWAKGEGLRHVEKDVLIPKIVREISRERCKPYLDGKALRNRKISVYSTVQIKLIM